MDGLFPVRPKTGIDELGIVDRIGSGFRCHSEFDPQPRNGIVAIMGAVNGAPLCHELIRLCNFP